MWLLLLVPLLYSRPLLFDAVLISLGAILVVLFRARPSDSKTIFKVMILVGIVNALSVIYQTIFPGPIEGLVSSHISEGQLTYFLDKTAKGYRSGINALVGDTAGYIVFAFGVLSCYLTTASKRIVRFTSLLTAPILVIALLCTGKRSHFLILMLCILSISLASGKGTQKVRRLAIFSLSAVVCYLIVSQFSHLFLHSSTIARFLDSFLGHMAGEDISSGRYLLYDYAWNEFLSSPILGIGWKTFLLNTTTKYGYTSTHYVNNDYLQVLCELGLVGFALTFTPMFLHLVKSYRCMRAMYICRVNAYPNVIRSITYCVFIQSFFLMYAFFENPYYNRSYLFMYFLSVALSSSIMQSRRYAMKRVALPRNHTRQNHASIGSRSQYPSQISPYG